MPCFSFYNVHSNHWPLVVTFPRWLFLWPTMISTSNIARETLQNGWPNLPGPLSYLIPLPVYMSSIWRIFQISPAASPAISHHTVWRTWIFIAYSILTSSLIHFYWEVGRMYFLSLGVKGLKHEGTIRVSRLTKYERTITCEGHVHRSCSKEQRRYLVSRRAWSSNWQKSKSRRNSPSSCLTCWPHRCSSRRVTAAAGRIRLSGSSSRSIQALVT